MKFLTTFILVIFLYLRADCQILEPVKWVFTSTKVDNGTYQIHLKAKLDSKWHIYSQVQPANAIAIPLQVTFAENNQIVLDGKPKEIGKMAKVYDKAIKAGAWQYSNNLDLVQVVKLKTPGKTILKGFVTFQVCNDEKCLPPEDKDFAVVLN